MGYAFTLPDFPVSTEAEQGIYSYLYRTVEQLNWVVSRFSAPSGSLTFLQGAPGAPAAPESRAEQNFNEIKSLIMKSADIINAYYDQIGARLRGSYVAKSEFGTYLENTTLDIEGTSTDIRQIFTRLEELTESMEGLENASVHTSAYIKSGLLETAEDGTGIYGLEVGQSNEVNGQQVFSKFARFTSGRVSFYDRNDTEVGYISDYKLYITNAQITGTLTLGGFALDTADGLAFRWVGGEGA